jgi:peptidoglycan/xylan/chitin deacetylase (PgdA/CDA1 family)
MAPLAVPFVWQVSPPLALGSMAAFHAPLLYGALRPNNQFFGPVATRFATDEPEVWLTIDDGPTPHDTLDILHLLEKRGARATFFVRGDRARAHPELIREIVRRGHGLGNHTDTHPQATFWALPPWSIRREIARCNAALREITGETPRWFRAPVGMVNPFVHPAAAAQGLRLVGWSARGYDGVARKAVPAQVVRRILPDLRPGAIVLLHEGRVSARGEAPNVRGLKLLLDALEERNFRTVLPSEDRLR